MLQGNSLSRSLCLENGLSEKLKNRECSTLLVRFSQNSLRLVSCSSANSAEGEGTPCSTAIAEACALSASACRVAGDTGSCPRAAAAKDRSNSARAFRRASLYCDGSQIHRKQQRITCQDSVAHGKTIFATESCRSCAINLS